MRTNHTFLTAAAAALALALSGPANAATPDFETRLAAAIERDMSFPLAQQRRRASGVVAVRFVAGESGRAAEVEIVESSGVADFDRAALRTISALDLPASAPPGPHVAILHYGQDTDPELSSRESARIAAAAGRAELALRGGAGSAARARTID